MKLAHNVRGGRWWYGTTGYIFPPISHYILLHCDKWQQRGTLTEWHLTWKYMWSKGVSLNSSMWKKWHPLTFTDTYWTLMETKQWMWTQWEMSGVFQQWWQRCERQAMFQMAMHLSTSVVCGLLFIAGENAQLMVVPLLTNSVLLLRICYCE